MSTQPANKRSNRFLFALVGFFCLWCVFVAVGATGMITDPGLFDIRRSLIVLGCAVIFASFWVWVMTRPLPKGNEPDTSVDGSGKPVPPARSGVSIVSLMTAGAAYVSWGLSWVAWNQGQPLNCYRLGYAAVALLGLAALLGLIGVSDPRPRPGKLLGLVSILLLVAGVIGFFIQASMTVTN